MEILQPTEVSTFICGRQKPRVLVIVTISVAPTRNPRASVTERFHEIVDESDSSLPNVDILEWRELVDSSEINLEHWVRIARDIELRYHQYDGFVVLHGTDTLAYTASALSFMLENLSKPVVLTGSILPIFHMQTDITKNLPAAIKISTNRKITEVCVLFGRRLLRGNRSSKLDFSQMDAFHSPNFPLLGFIGVDVTIDDRLLVTPSKEVLRLFPHFCMNITIVPIRPGFQTLLWELFASPTRPLAVILKLDGTCTAPVKDGTLLDVIQTGIQEGVEILCLTQCPSGLCSGTCSGTCSGNCSLLTYENRLALHRLGVIDGKDLTTEAAFAKLGYLMGKGHSFELLQTTMGHNLKGELSEEFKENKKTTRKRRNQMAALNDVLPNDVLPSTSSNNNTTNSFGAPIRSSRKCTRSLSFAPIRSSSTTSQSSSGAPIRSSSRTAAKTPIQDQHLEFKGVNQLKWNKNRKVKGLSASKESRQKEQEVDLGYRWREKQKQKRRDLFGRSGGRIK